MYLLFVTYIGCIHLGIPDGIYLRYSGKRYDEIVGDEIKLLFWISSLIECIVGICIFCYVARSSISQLALAFGLCTVVYVPSLYLKYLILASNMMKEYSLYVLSEKIVSIVTIIFGLLLYKPILNNFIYVDIIGKTVAFTYALIVCKSCFSLHVCKINDLWKELIVNIAGGICLMISTVSSNFIVGVIRIFINAQWSIEDFGKVSLSLQISNFVLTFVRAVSLPLFPVLKMRCEDESVALYEKIRLGLVSLILFVLIFYYPLAGFLNYWLPEYQISIYYLGILFPICLFEAKQALLCETYLKSFRKERFLLLINVGTMFLSVAISGVIIFRLKNQLFAIIFILFILCFRSTISELYLNRCMGRKVFKHIVLEIFMAALFAVLNISFSVKISAIVYIIFFLIFILINKNGYKKIFEIQGGK